MLDRRTLLSRLSTTALLLGAHSRLSWAVPEPEGSGETVQRQERDDPRILELTLLTSASLKEMSEFYGDMLGLPIVADGARKIVVSAGSTKINFVSAKEETVAPFYHFAFNIPENKILAARSWQAERTPLFLTPDNLRDPAYPDDVRHFRSWNAHSVFFWDPAGNVVEFIARHDLRNGSDAPFGPEDILYASEIAFIVDDVLETAAWLQKGLGLAEYRRGSEFFCATGDELGLLLLFKRGRQIGDTLRGRPAPAEVFSTRAEIRGTDVGGHDLTGYPYQIAVRG